MAAVSKYVGASTVPTPKSSASMNRVAAYAPARPTTEPATTGRKPSSITILNVRVRPPQGGHAIMLLIRNGTNHSYPAIFVLRPSEFETLPNRIGSAEIGFRQRFIHQRNGRAGSGIELIQETAAKQWCAHGVEIVPRHDVMPELPFVIVTGASLDGCIAGPGSAAQPESQRHSPCLHICLFSKPA